MTQKQIEEIKLRLSLDNLEKIVRDYFNLDFNKPFKNTAAICYIALVLHVRNVHIKPQITQSELADKMGISRSKLAKLYAEFNKDKQTYMYSISKLLTKIYFQNDNDNAN